MKTISPQDALLITYHGEDDDKICQKVVRTSLAEAINQGNLALRQDGKIKSFRVLDTLYNSKYKEMPAN